jgi:DNA-binding HxlR family transcriptional regulator
MAITLATDVDKITRVVSILQGKWTVHILCRVREHPVRLGQLKRAIPFASKKGLTASLRMLEDANIVIRRDFSDSRLHVEYELNEATREPLLTLLQCLIDASVVLHCSDDRPPIRRAPRSDSRGVRLGSAESGRV